MPIIGKRSCACCGDRLLYDAYKRASACDFVFLEFGLANEEHVNVISLDTVNQTFAAIVTKDHPAGSSIRPSIWPTAVLLEGNDLAFDIKAVAAPDPGSDLTVVVQT